MAISFYWAFRDWLFEAWEHRLRRKRCDECKRRIWAYGEPAPVLCCKACKESWQVGIPF